jgi:hypothetical protein
VLFILDPTEAAQAAIGKRVTVADYPDGRLVISYQGTPLAGRALRGVIAPRPPAARPENHRSGHSYSAEGGTFLIRLDTG